MNRSVLQLGDDSLIPLCRDGSVAAIDNGISSQPQASTRCVAVLPDDARSHLETDAIEAYIATSDNGRY